MFYQTTRIFNKFFKFFSISKVEIFKSSGLILIKDFVLELGLIGMFKNIPDSRNPLRILYSLPEQLTSILLQILSGEVRLSHNSKLTTDKFYSKLYDSSREPHFTTFRYLVNKNPYLKYFLEQILFQLTMNVTKKAIKEKKLRTITIDIDQTDSIIHGKQEGAVKGYSSKGKNNVVFQNTIWMIRELKLIFKVELRSGESNCAKNFLERLKPVIRELKKLDVRILVSCDSGYENQTIFEYLANEDVFFIFAKRQTKKVKKKGKFAKKKVSFKNQGLLFKERKLKIENENFQGHFREIFVQNKIEIDELGQMYFKDFASDEFTNIFVTNLKAKPKHLYETYKKHAVIETVIEELKNDFGFGISHNNQMSFNQAFANLTALAFNIKVLFLKKKAEIENSYNDDLPIQKLSTFQRNFIHTPAILVNHSGKMILKLSEQGFNNFKALFLYFGYTPL